ncbi:MAG: alpha/beta hydrolase family protein [Thermomicrobiales bacterium]
MPNASSSAPSTLTRRSAVVAGSATALSSAVALGLHGRTSAEATPAASPGASPAASPSATTVDPVIASVPHVFTHDTFQFQSLIVLGAVYERAADVGEIFATTSQIAEGDYQGWLNAWKTTGDRVAAIADASDQGGHRASAREAYLRASNYYAQACFVAEGTDDPSQGPALFELHRNAWDNFVARLDVPAEQVTIPYEDTTLPGYAFRVDDSGAKRPWIIFNNGSDGSMTDMWAEGIGAALRRGYNALAFDGPGQNAALYRQHLSFRPDWEKVITPVVDYLETREDVDTDRIAILGVSQGGYWVPRAVAFEHRIAAAIVDPGVISVLDAFTQDIPPKDLEELFTATGEELEEVKKGFDQYIAEGEAEDPDLKFTIRFRLLPYGTDSFAEGLLLARDYVLDDATLDKITCPVIVSDPAGETFFPGQPQKFFDALKTEKTLVRFTAAEGADLHCEPKANGLRAQRFYDWLDDTLSYNGGPGR